MSWGADVAWKSPATCFCGAFRALALGLKPKLLQIKLRQAFKIEEQSNIWQQETDNAHLASTNNMSNSEMALLRFWWQFTPTQAPTYLDRTLMAKYGHPSSGLESHWPCASSSCDCMNEAKTLYERSSYAQMLLLSQCHMLRSFSPPRHPRCCLTSWYLALAMRGRECVVIRGQVRGQGLNGTGGFGWVAFPTESLRNSSC